MKIKFLKDHLLHKAGTEEDVGDLLANYLIRVGAAEEVKEKVEVPKAKEKAENKTGNVPTAKKKK